MSPNCGSTGFFIHRSPCLWSRLTCDAEATSWGWACGISGTLLHELHPVAESCSMCWLGALLVTMWCLYLPDEYYLRESPAPTDFLNQNLHFTKVFSWLIYTFNFEEQCTMKLKSDSLFSWSLDVEPTEYHTHTHQVGKNERDIKKENSRWAMSQWNPCIHGIHRIERIGAKSH